MTKRHFEAFARAVKAELDGTKDAHAAPSEVSAITHAATFAANLFADLAAQDNPRFDRPRFMRACGLEV